MSVEVKTPSPHLFEETKFQCRKRAATISKDMIAKSGDDPKIFNQSGGNNEGYSRERSATWSGQGRGGRKRRASERAEYRGHHGHHHRKRFCRYGPRHGKIILPTRFLLGGNIHDPLNLASMLDEKVNRELNEKTPESSPLPVPSYRSKVEVVIPVDMTDPLNLKGGEDAEVQLISPKAKRKRFKHRNKKRDSTGEDTNKNDLLIGDEGSGSRESRRDSDYIKPSRTLEKKMLDKIVSPVIPQDIPKKRRRRTSSEGCSRSDQEDDRISPHKFKPKYHRQQSNNPKPLPKPKKNPGDKKVFEYGNYDRYYGYRNPNHVEDDRLGYLKRDWFVDQEVLDIGCNSGDITLAIAKKFAPKQILGIDIDGRLIGKARVNLRRTISYEMVGAGKFPESMSIMYGPLVGPPLGHKLSGGSKRSKDRNFLNNVKFTQCNYVLESDELLALEREQYDVILALSISKWIHLNHGDNGLKRFFKRIYRQLRPGGKFILEPQAWTSYKRKKKLTPTIWENYQKIQMKPEYFSEYLLSGDVGFATCEVISTSDKKREPKGFQRLVQLFIKPTTAYPTPRGSSRFNTPSLLPASSHATPTQHVYAPLCQLTPVEESNTDNIDLHSHLNEINEQDIPQGEIIQEASIMKDLTSVNNSPAPIQEETFTQSAASYDLEMDVDLQQHQNSNTESPRAAVRQSSLSFDDRESLECCLVRTRSAPSILLSSDFTYKSPVTSDSSSSSSDDNSSSSSSSASYCEECADSATLEETEKEVDSSDKHCMLNGNGTSLTSVTNLTTATTARKMVPTAYVTPMVRNVEGSDSMAHVEPMVHNAEGSNNMAHVEPIVHTAEGSDSVAHAEPMVHNAEGSDSVAHVEPVVHNAEGSDSVAHVEPMVHNAEGSDSVAHVEPMVHNAEGSDSVARIEPMVHNAEGSDSVAHVEPMVHNAEGSDSVAHVEPMVHNAEGSDSVAHVEPMVHNAEGSDSVAHVEPMVHNAEGSDSIARIEPMVHNAEGSDSVAHAEPMVHNAEGSDSVACIEPMVHNAEGSDNMVHVETMVHSAEGSDSVAHVEPMVHNAKGSDNVVHVAQMPHNAERSDNVVHVAPMVHNAEGNDSVVHDPESLQNLQQMAVADEQEIQEHELNASQDVNEDVHALSETERD